MDLLLLVQVLALLWLSAVFSGSETGIYTLSRVKLRYRLSEGNDRRAKVMERLTNPVGPTIITILIGNNIAAELLASAGERTFAPLGPPWSVLLTVVVLTPLVLMFAEFLPKHLFRRNADAWMYRLAYGLLGIRLVLSLPVRLVQMLTWILERLLLPGGKSAEIWEPHTSRDNLRTFLGTEASGVSLSPVQQALVDRVLALERMTVDYGGVSKPLATIASLDADARVDAARTGLGPKYYQRYLVRDHDSSLPIGYVSAAALVAADGEVRIGDLAQDLPSLDQQTPIHAALQRMHAAGVDLALVRDTAGDAVSVAFRGDCLRVLVNLD